MPSFSQEDILNAVTYALGSPSEAEYSEEKKLSALKRAFIEFSKYKPKKNLGKFTTVIGQQEYDVGTSYAYMIGITDVYYNSSASITDDLDIFEQVITETITNNMDLGLLNSEVLQTINKRNIATLQEASRLDFEIINTGTIALIPCPEDENEVFFSYSTIKTINELDEGDFQDIVDFAFLISAMDLAMKRHKIQQLSDPGSGYIMFTGGKFLQDQAEKVRIRLQNRLGVSTLITHG